MYLVFLCWVFLKRFSELQYSFVKKSIYVSGLRELNCQLFNQCIFIFNTSSRIIPCHVPKHILASNQNKRNWKYKCLYYQHILTTQKRPLNYILQSPPNRFLNATQAEQGNIWQCNTIIGTYWHLLAGVKRWRDKTCLFRATRALNVC